ncbi:MAG TPA: PAS domain S-box protein, partial [Bacteroidota bacterium]
MITSRQSETVFLQALEHLRLAAFQVDAEDAGLFISLSPSVLQIAGLPAWELLAGSRRWTDLIHRDDLRAVLDARTAACRSEEKCYSVQYRIIRPDGEARWLEERGSCNQPRILCGVIDDITERIREIRDLRESEAKYRELMERAGDAIVAADALTGIILEVNQKACELFDYTREELIGRHQRELHPRKFQLE